MPKSNRNILDPLTKAERKKAGVNARKGKCHCCGEMSLRMTGEFRQYGRYAKRLHCENGCGYILVGEKQAGRAYEREY